MLVKLVGPADQILGLSKAVAASLEELGLTGVVTVQETSDPEYAKALNITKFPALAIEEEAIDFKDMIFEGVVPPKEELTGMFVSILGGATSGGGCGSGGCGTCGSGGCSTEPEAHDHAHDHAQAPASEGSCGTGCGCH